MAKRQQTTEQRRELLIESAMECFVENGIAQTGIRDIAKHAGVSLGNLYNHFRGKNALIAEIAKLESHWLSEFVQQIDQISDGASALESFVNQYLDYAADLYQAVLTVEITAMALRDPKVATLFEDNRNMLITCLSNLIERGKAQENFAQTVDTANSAGLILDLVEAFGLRLGLNETKPGQPERAALQNLLRNGLGVKTHG